MIFAYLDPGAGSLVIQAVLAAALAIPFFLRTQIAAIVRAFRGDQDREDDSERR